MVKAINGKKGTEEPAKRANIEMRKCQNMRIEDFVTINTMTFFCRFGISAGFLNCDPDLWPQQDDYKNAIKTVEHLRVVNDNAERVVALIEEYNSIITKKENQNSICFKSSRNIVDCFQLAEKTSLLQDRYHAIHRQLHDRNSAEGL